jgi:hypothetical protein
MSTRIKHIGEVARAFEVSIAAAIIRVPEVDSLPAIVARYDRQRICWRAFAPHVPRRSCLSLALNEDSFTYEIAHGVV